MRINRSNAKHAIMCFLLGATLHAIPALSADQVLVMTISDYRTTPLLGVRHDAGNAIQLAQKLGYDTAQALVLSNDQLTAQKMRLALSDFAARVQTNDRVFLYYSGHGASYLNGGQCTAALVGQDEKFVDTREIKKHIDQIKSKVQDAFVVIDACHSGGHQDLALMAAGGRTRGGKSAVAAEGLSGKGWTPKEGERCDMPVNIANSWPSPVLGARSISNPDNNLTFIAAAGEQQVALDDKDHGGLATTSLLQCVSNGVASNGLATPAALAMCAQENINVSVPRLNAKYGSKWTAHEIQVYGNGQRPLAYVKTMEPSAGVSIQGASSPRADQLIKSFEQILAGANGNWTLSVQPTVQRVALNQPDSKRAVFFPYETAQAGYGYLLYVGTDGVDMKQMFPGPLAGNNRMPMQGQFPGIRIDGPAGKNTFLFILSQTPRNFAEIFKGAGVEANRSNLVKVQCETVMPNSVRVGGSSPCPQNRNAAVLTMGTASTIADAGLEGYAAQIIIVEGL